MIYLKNIIFLFFLCPRIYGELFTSIADLQRLLYAEKSLPEIINQYIETKKSHLDELKNLIEQYKRSNLVTSDDTSSVANPINAFLLIKRLANTWKDVQDRMKEDVASVIIHNVSSTYRFPVEEDLDGAVVGLLRLQDTYRLDTHQLADGIALGKQVFRKLTAHDCFEIARHAYNHQDYYHTLMWIQEALDRSKGESPKTINEVEALEYLHFSLFKQGNLKRALQATDKILKLDPYHSRARESQEWYEKELENEGVKRSEWRKNIPTLVNARPKDFHGLSDFNERQTYETLCRGEFVVSPKEIDKLYCYYKRDRPFLRIAPIKVEIVRQNPLAVMFREVISDEEIEVIQEMAKPRLNRATAWNGQQYVTVDYRISKSAWLKEWEHEVVKRVNRRVDLMTNLDMETAEDLQIANYGIGGHYDPHFDHSSEKKLKGIDAINGNRIATVLFYLSQPELGGATVFTEIKTTAYPSKNDALFWYNLHRTGEGDKNTRHAACPVLLGVKWVANKWIHERGQEWRRPCGLKPYAGERFVGDIGQPEPRYHPNI